MGNVLGAIVGAVALVGLPELFRVAAEYRILIYGVVLLLLDPLPAARPDGDGLGHGRAAARSAA